MKESDVVLALFPQADGSAKTRPAVVLRKMPPFGDLLVCGISTQLRQKVEGFDEIIAVSDSDFAASGLVAESVIRLGFLVSLPDKLIAGAIGSISEARHQRLLKRLSDYLTAKSDS